MGRIVEIEESTFERIQKTMRTTKVQMRLSIEH